MKTFCGFIGWIVGMFIGFAIIDKVPFLSFVFIFSGIFVGRYIGKLIEDNRERSRLAQEEAQRQAKQREAERQRTIKLRNEAIALARKYPMATKSYFNIHWGITKSSISEYDITDDKVVTLLSHKYTYEIDEQRLNASYRAKLLAEKETKKRQEEAKKAAARQAELARKRTEEQEKKALPSKVSSWNTLFGNFHYTYLLRYFPTTCDFEATESEWEDRYTVWNFKNTPGKTSLREHLKALDTVIPKVKSKLISTFGRSALKHITLVCIPASTAIKTEARYKEFSRRLCDETGMANAYWYMDVVSSSAEKKFGGSGISTDNVEFDSNFFRGRYIILFDDVITKGESMLRFKRKMEELGAIVLGGISIGKTTHSR